MNAEHAHDQFSAWETAQWLGVSVERLMALEFDGLVPSPTTTGPVSWSEADLIQWRADGCPTRNE